MKILVLGATGMLGHKLAQRFVGEFETWATVRGDVGTLAAQPGLGGVHPIPGVNVQDALSLRSTLEQVRPDVVVNCIGVVKQLDKAVDTATYIEINALLPHRLADMCQTIGARLIQFSTDCVFSGKKGPYDEDSAADALDVYGHTKLLGEVAAPGCLTLRSSIIGRELRGGLGLVEWALAQTTPSIPGFTQALFTGFPTLFMARIVRDIIVGHPGLEGIWHVSSDAISKYELLCLIGKAFAAPWSVRPDDGFACDRRLDSTRFRTATGFAPLPWTRMIEEMADDARNCYRSFPPRGHS